VQPLFTSDDYGYANLAETGDGDLLFVQIPNERALVQAIQAGESGEKLAEQQPQPRILRLSAGGVCVTSTSKKKVGNEIYGANSPNAAVVRATS
jgi:hypothetical protein